MVEGKKRRLSLEKKSGKSGAYRCPSISPITGILFAVTTVLQDIIYFLFIFLWFVSTKC